MIVKFTVELNICFPQLFASMYMFQIKSKPKIFVFKKNRRERTLKTLIQFKNSSYLYHRFLSSSSMLIRHTGVFVSNIKTVSLKVWVSARADTPQSVILRFYMFFLVIFFLLFSTEEKRYSELISWILLGSLKC